MLFVYNHFEKAARAQAKGLGLEDLKIYKSEEHTSELQSH